ncbi:MAG: hypothetical protein WKG03_16440 [Telluria sp.]
MKNFKAETIVSRLFAAMNNRKQALIDGEFVVSSEFKGLLDNFDVEGNSYRQFLQAVENTKKIFDFEPLLKIATKHKPSGAHDSQYVQAKALEKIVKFTKAFGYKDFRMLDNHTRNIMMNTMVNNGIITSKGAFASLVKCEFDALDSQDEKLAYRANYSAGTGSTQLSSTRELFRILGLTDGVKGAKDAPIEFTAQAKEALTQHFETIAKKIGVEIETEETEVEEIEA